MFISISEIEASGKVLWIQTEGPLKLGDGGVRLSLFKQSCALWWFSSWLNLKCELSSVVGG